MKWVIKFFYINQKNMAGGIPCERKFEINQNNVVRFISKGFYIKWMYIKNKPF